MSARGALLALALVLAAPAGAPAESELRYELPEVGSYELPVIDRVVPLERAAEAHRAMERNEHFGKIVLAVS